MYMTAPLRASFSFPSCCYPGTLGCQATEELLRCGELEMSSLAHDQRADNSFAVTNKLPSNQQPPAIGTRSFPSLSYPQAVPSDLGVLITSFCVHFQNTQAMIFADETQKRAMTSRKSLRWVGQQGRALDKTRKRQPQANMPLCCLCMGRHAQSLISDFGN